jgi:N-acetylglucosaminyldiphosphoundecaprenol N-acetyl-beta-D-mannosaminyltransferase
MNETGRTEAARLGSRADTAADRFLDLPFSFIDLQQAVAHVRQASEAAQWNYVVTPNAAHLARLGGSDPELRRIYESAHLCLLDSRVVARVARLAGLKTPPVVTGADLVAELFARVVEPSSPICIVGGTPMMVQRLRERFRVGEIAHLNPSSGFWREPDEMARVADFIVSSQASLTFLVVGSPQQEILADLVASRGGARGVGICAGASLEFLTEMRRRAPRALQRLSLEWAYRLCMEPRRMARRYLVESPDGILLVLREALRQ